jgi:hypothetical protein
MGVAGPGSPFPSADFTFVISTRASATGRQGFRSTGPAATAGAGARRGSSDDDDPGQRPGLICERVERVLGRVQPHNGFGHLPPLLARQGVASIRHSAPEAATPTGPCWRCRVRHESAPSRTTIQGVLEAVIRDTALPALRRRHRPAAPSLDVQAEKLADALLALRADIDRVIDEVESIARPFGRTAVVRAPLFEQCARVLGDRWALDACDQFQVTLALSTLEAALDGMTPAWPGLVEAAPSVLVVTPPDEPHRLGAVLADRALQHAGWCTTRAAPESAAALEEMLAGERFDALHIALSCALRRDHLQADLARTIARARAASRNPGLVVSLGGRLVTEAPDAWTLIGADAGCTSAATLQSALETVLAR